MVDTAALVFDTPRQPSKKTFTPIGHVGLQRYSERNVRFSIPLNTLWVKSLYISGYYHLSYPNQDTNKTNTSPQSPPSIRPRPQRHDPTRTSRLPRTFQLHRHRSRRHARSVPIIRRMSLVALGRSRVAEAGGGEKYFGLVQETGV